MTEFVRINRRLFLARLGKGTMAVAILGACGPDNAGSTTSGPTTPAHQLRFNCGAADDLHDCGRRFEQYFSG